MGLIMNLIHLQTFLAVATSGSFTQAAVHLDVSKGLVSRHVKHLEKSLNARLFHRTTRSIRLTEEGRELYSKAKQIQILAKEAELRIKDYGQEISGKLRVTAPLSLGQKLCQQVVPDFCNKYPKIVLNLSFGAGSKDVEFGEFDIAFRASEDLPDNVIAKDLGFIKNVLVCSPQLPVSLKADDIITLQEQSFIINGQVNQWNTLQMVKGAETYQIAVNGRIASNTYESIYELAIAGLGIACLPFYLVEQSLKSGVLVRVFPDWVVKTHQLYALYSQRRITPQKVLVFRDRVKDWFQEGEYALAK